MILLAKPSPPNPQLKPLRKTFNLPNILTLSRFFLTAVFMQFLFMEGPLFKGIALFVFLTACLTDYLDGHIARKQGLVTPLGKLLDPIADKVLIFSAFLSFVEMNILPAWMVMVMLGREVLITGFRLLGTSRGVVLPATRGGKHKTAIQAISIVVIVSFLIAVDLPFWNTASTASVLKIIQWTMLVVVISTLASGVSYTAKHWRKVSESFD